MSKTVGKLQHSKPINEFVPVFGPNLISFNIHKLTTTNVYNLEIEAKLGDGWTVHSGPSFARLR